MLKLLPYYELMFCVELFKKLESQGPKKHKTYNAKTEGQNAKKHKDTPPGIISK